MCCLEELEDVEDEIIQQYIDDPNMLRERVKEDFNQGDLYNTDIDCFITINNDVRIFQEMIEYMKKGYAEYTYDGNIVKLFHEFTYVWVQDRIDDEDMGFVELMDEELEKEMNKRFGENNDDENDEEIEDQTDEESESEEEKDSLH
jgi:hypothetical protein